MDAASIDEKAHYFFPPPPKHTLESHQLSQLPNRTGVYFFWNKNAVSYVGETTELKRRLRGHEKWKVCEAVSFIECDRVQRKRLEAFYIGVLDPPLNKESSYACAEQEHKPTAVFTGKETTIKRLFGFIELRPGISLSRLRKASGWHRKASYVRKDLERLKEWRLVREETVETAGRPKSIFYATKRKLSADEKQIAIAFLSMVQATKSRECAAGDVAAWASAAMGATVSPKFAGSALRRIGVSSRMLNGRAIFRASDNWIASLKSDFGLTDKELDVMA